MFVMTCTRVFSSNPPLQVMLALVLCLAGGCYDGDAMLKQAQSTALSASLAEVDLGQFTTTLPRDPASGIFTALELHVFCTVPRARLADVKKQLQVEGYRLRHETLAAVRRCTRDELSEPTLANLRTRLEEVINKVLTDAPVKDIGFYQLTLR